MALAIGKAIAQSINYSTLGLVSQKSVQGLFGGKPQGVQSPEPIPLPQPPSQSDAEAKGANIVNKRRVAMSQSIYTSPLGVSGQAAVATKSLLGQ